VIVLSKFEKILHEFSEEFIHTSIRNARGTTLNIFAKIISPLGRVNSSG
jgi:hypothetical protein